MKQGMDSWKGKGPFLLVSIVNAGRPAEEDAGKPNEP